MRSQLARVALFALVFAWLFTSAGAQQPGFDLQDYKNFLIQSAGMSGTELLAQHPAPLLFSETPESVAHAAFLDDVSQTFDITYEERLLLEKNGFLVTDRLRYPTFTKAFARVWHEDLPVFISTDAILHALHLSYDKILEHLEKDLLMQELADVLTALRQQQSVLENTYGTIPAMRQPLRDVDLYISVARTLMGASPVPFYPETAQDLNAVLQMIDERQPRSVALFSSTERIYDFSQFTVRGHYTNIDLGPLQLSQYFQVMIWLGRTEFMLTTPVSQGQPQQKPEDIQRQIIDAALLLEALTASDAGEKLARMDALLAKIVGESDNVDPAHFREAMVEAGMVDAATFLDTTRVRQFQSVLATKPWAQQRISSQILMSDPMTPEQIAPPTAFLLMGQRFVIDSYVMANVVFDRIIHNGTKVRRMEPSTMDVLFAIGNNAAAQFLQDDLATHPYAANLNALRYLIDSHGGDFWNASMYNSWLHAIRALNIPEEVDELPPFMQTAAWWQQKMNTQLAAWAQLRHDNLLYAKQSYTGGVTCSYPQAYVEPVPEFYRRLSTFASNAKLTFDAEGLQMQSDFFAFFGSVMDTLGIIAEKQLTGAALTAQQQSFAKAVLYQIPNCGVAYSGWYPKLIYEVFQWQGQDSEEPADIVVADVHTAPTDDHGSMQGLVLHVGTGEINLGVFVAPGEGGKPTAYVGPVLSYYEHTTQNFQRLYDYAWKQSVVAGQYPRPDWTHAYLADRDGNRQTPGPLLRTKSPPVQQPILSCGVSVPEITADYENLRYDPMPFPVTVTVENIGNQLTDSITARIELPDDLHSSLRLAGADAPDNVIKLVQKPRLFPGQSGTAQWMIQHPPTSVEKRYTVGVWVRARNADSSYCEAEVVIPKLAWPILSPRCVTPDSLRFDDELGSYAPNPFDVRLTCVNTGNMRADSVTGTIVLPEDVVLDPPGQPKTKYFNPMSMEHWQVGDPIPELEWTVRWTKRLRYDVRPIFSFLVTGVNEAGMRLDSVEVRCDVPVPGLLPYYSCLLEIPDSLALNAAGTEVEPNPFTVRYTIRNISHQVGSIDRVLLYFPISDGLSLNPASPNPVSFDPKLSLDGGEEETFEWIIDVTNRITRRNVEIQVMAFDDQGNPIPCAHRLPIANLRTGMSCDQLEANEPVLHYDAASDSYDPDSFVITTTLRNTGGANLSDIEAHLTWTDNSGQDLIEFNPAFPDNTNPKTRGVLYPSTETEFSWGFRLKNRNTTGIPQYLRFNIEYGSRETPYITDGCETYVQIDPAGTTGAAGAPAPSRCVLHPVHPNPFRATSVISYSLPRAVPVTLTVTDALGREVRRLVDAELRAAGEHTLRFDAAGLKPGIYFTRLAAGETVRMRKMILMR